MKQILFNLLIVVAALCSFSSCKDDDDRNLAIVLSGEWEGNFGANYTISINGSTPQTYSTRKSHLVFDPKYDYAKRGNGFEIDYYDNGPYDYLRYDFKWKVEDGIITLTFLDFDPIETLVIDNYDMDSDDFWGTIGDKTFHLSKIVNHYDWTSYDSFSRREGEDVETDHNMSRASEAQIRIGHKLQ